MLVEYKDASILCVGCFRYYTIDEYSLDDSKSEYVQTYCSGCKKHMKKGLDVKSIPNRLENWKEFYKFHCKLRGRTLEVPPKIAKELREKENLKNGKIEVSIEEVKCNPKFKLIGGDGKGKGMKYRFLDDNSIMIVPFKELPTFKEQYRNYIVE